MRVFGEAGNRNTGLYGNPRYATVSVAATATVARCEIQRLVDRFFFARHHSMPATAAAVADHTMPPTTMAGTSNAPAKPAPSHFRGLSEGFSRWSTIAMAMHAANGRAANTIDAMTPTIRFRLLANAPGRIEMINIGFSRNCLANHIFVRLGGTNQTNIMSPANMPMVAPNTAHAVRPVTAPTIMPAATTASILIVIAALSELLKLMCITRTIAIAARQRPTAILSSSKF